MAKLSHFGFAVYLTAASALAAPTGSSPIPLAVSQRPQFNQAPKFEALFTDSMEKAGVAHSFIESTETTRVRTERLVPIEVEKWEAVRGDAAKHLARMFESIENNVGHLFIHEIKVETVSLVEDPEAGTEKEFRVVVVRWSPRHGF